MQDFTFTPDELYARAQGNANALMCATIAYLKEHDLPVADWATAVGRQFARGWSGAVDPTRAARGMALNAASVGGRVVGQVSDDASAEVTFTDWPPREMLAVYRVAQEDADTFFGEVTVGIMDALGMRAEWRREGERLTLRFTR